MLTKDLLSVSIFGTALEDNPLALENARKVSLLLAEDGRFKILTGGQNAGTMKVITETTHSIAQQKNNSAIEPIGVPIPRWEPVTCGEINAVNTLSQKLQYLIDNAGAYVALTGRMGTFVETITTLHTLHYVDSYKDGYVKPLIIFDPTQKITRLLSMLDKEYHFTDNERLKTIIFLANSAEEVYFLLDFFYRQRFGKQKQGNERSEEEKKVKQYLLYPTKLCNVGVNV